MVDRLHPDRIRAELGEVLIGREIIVLDETASTNDVIRRLAANGAAEGLVVIAERQTAGRGQRGNKWSSVPYKGLTFSVLLQPGLRVRDSARLTSWAADTIAWTLHNDFSIEAVVKSPNDVYVNGQKIAGVLVEMIAQSNAPHLAVLGIGINVNEDGQDLPPEVRDRATSLALATRCQQSRHRLAVCLLTNLDQRYTHVKAKRSTA